MKFFVSYRRRDETSRSLAAELLSELTDRGHVVVVDVHELKLGADWESVLAAQIAACDAVVLLVCRGIGESRYVPQELRTAARYEKPVLPVLVQYPEPRDADVGEEVAAVLRTRQFAHWTSPANTLWLVERLAKWTPKDKSPPTVQKRRRWWLAIVALLFLVAAVLATMRVMGIREADALDRDAAPLLKSTDRADIDHGLALSAFAASKREDAPSSAASAKYAELHYDRLLATLRASSIGSGNALAVSPRGDAILDGGRVWTCVPPAPLWRCNEPRLRRLANAGPLRDAAFASSETIVTLGIKGLALRWGIGGDATALSTGTPATAIAAHDGEIAIAFVGNIIVYGANGSMESPPDYLPSAINKLAFGPCSRCITLRDDSGYIFLWDRNRGLVRGVRGSTHALAASPRGTLVLAAEDAVSFYDARLASSAVVRPRIPLDTVTAMDVSDDGREAVLVHDGRVTIVGVNGNETRIISGSASPHAVAARFSGDVLVTRSPTEVRVWRRGSVERQPAVPRNVWPEWRERLGFLVDGRGEVAERVFEANGGTP